MSRCETLSGLVAAGLTGHLSAELSLQQRTLGRTGEKVSCLGLGGYQIGKPKPSDHEAVRLIRYAIDHGLNLMDNSWDYNEAKARFTWATLFAIISCVPQERSHSLSQFCD